MDRGIKVEERKLKYKANPTMQVGLHCMCVEAWEYHMHLKAN